MIVPKIAAAIAAAVKPVSTTYNEEWGEYDVVKYGPLTLWRRDSHGRPRLLGIPFPRWARGPRK